MASDKKDCVVTWVTIDSSDEEEIIYEDESDLEIVHYSKSVFFVEEFSVSSSLEQSSPEISNVSKNIAQQDSEDKFVPAQMVRKFISLLLLQNNVKLS